MYLFISIIIFLTSIHNYMIHEKKIRYKKKIS
nr:MAG TPA: hypothetical protein [Caudoviricetes sp.]